MLTSQIHDIKLKINSLITRNAKLQEKIGFYHEDMERLQKENKALKESLKEKEEKLVALKTANAMLGSDEYKTKTKLKINALIREIDQCINQLAS